MYSYFKVWIGLITKVIVDNNVGQDRLAGTKGDNIPTL